MTRVFCCKPLAGVASPWNLHTLCTLEEGHKGDCCCPVWRQRSAGSLGIWKRLKAKIPATRKGVDQDCFVAIVAYIETPTEKSRYDMMITAAKTENMTFVSMACNLLDYVRIERHDSLGWARGLRDIA
jgi:hypothetical protein